MTGNGRAKGVNKCYAMTLSKALCPKEEAIKGKKKMYVFPNEDKANFNDNAANKARRKAIAQRMIVPGDSWSTPQVFVTPRPSRPCYDRALGLLCD